VDRYDWYFEQLVTEAHMDQAFGWAEEADWLIRQNAILKRGSGGSGDPIGAIHWGGTVTQNAAPDLNVLVSAGACTDPTGRETSWAAQQVVDCSVDYLAASTAVTTPGEEKYLGLFALWNRDLTDPVTDGNGLTVYFKQYDSFILRIVQGAQAVSATPPPTPTDAIRMANILLSFGQTQILNSDIRVDTAGFLRDDYVRVTGINLSNFIYGNPANAIEQLFQYIDLYSAGTAISFTGTSDWHDASGALASSNVSGAINEIVADLAEDNAGSGGEWGSDKIGSDAHTTGGGYADLARGSIWDQLVSLADDLDGHIGGGAPQHPASAITFTPYSYLAATDLQAVIQEIVDDLASQTAGSSGTTRIGARGILDSPTILSAGTLDSQIAALLTAINARARKGSSETISASWLFEQLIRLNDENAYIQGEETTSHYFPIFQHSTLRGRMYYNGIDGAIVITYNAWWDQSVSRWKYDSNGEESYRWQLDIWGIAFARIDSSDPNHVLAGWTDSQWTGELQWGRGGSVATAMDAFARCDPTLGYSYYDQVKVCLSAENTDSVSQVITDAAAVSWHSKMPVAIVSGDISLTVQGVSNWGLGPTVLFVDEWGAVIRGNSGSLAQGVNAYWYGRVEVDMTV